MYGQTDTLLGVSGTMRGDSGGEGMVQPNAHLMSQETRGKSKG